jgi:ferritin-like protein
MSFKKRKQVRICDSFTGSIVGIQPGVRDVLAQAYASEFVAYEFYTRYIGFLSGTQVHAVERMLQEFAWDELDHHARMVKERLAILGVDHGVTLANMASINPIPEVSSPACSLHYIAAVAYLEKKTVEFYKAAIALVKETGDTVTQNLLEDILRDEEIHLAASSRLACQLVGDAVCEPQFALLTYPVVTLFQIKDHVANIVAFYNYVTGAAEYTEPEFESDAQVAEAISKCKQAVAVEDYSQVCLAAQQGNPCILPSENLTVAFNGDNAIITADSVCCECKADSISAKLFSKFRNRETADSLQKVLDEMQERTVNGKQMKVQKFNNGEEANKFLEQNKGFTPVDQDEQGGVYVALESQTK